MSIRSLELRARVVVEGFWSGLHRSPYHGFSVEFTEYRQYSPGDDPRYLDWRAFGRTDRHYIKKFEDETNLRCQLVVDQSRSMAFASSEAVPTKAAYAATLAATFAWFLHLQGDATGLFSFDNQLRDFLPARHRPGHLRQLMIALDKPPGGEATDLAVPLEALCGLVRKRGWIVVLSDFLAPIDRLDTALTTLAASGHELVVFQILDPAEVSFNFTEPAWFEDLESKQTLFVDPAAARAGYLQRLEAHTTALKGICERLGITWSRIQTNQPLDLVLLEFVREQGRRGRAVRAIGPAAGKGPA
jgi:uncharacterized protein (DUF58 family)